MRRPEDRPRAGGILRQVPWPQAPPSCLVLRLAGGLLAVYDGVTLTCLLTRLPWKDWS